MDQEEARIAKALGTKKVPGVNEKNLLKYRKYFLANFNKDVVLTGREDFPWEEAYAFGFGDKREYEKQKKTRLSYEDKFLLLEILEEEMEENDLIAKVRRLSDRKIFTIGLSWLTTVAEKGNDFQLLNDFASWVVNW
jgi:hypothetical protein